MVKPHNRMNKAARENRLRMAGGVTIIAGTMAAIGYVVASIVAYVWFGHSEQDLTWIARNYMALKEQYNDRWVIFNVIILGFFCAGLLLSGRVLTEKLTEFGTTRWMSEKEMEKKKFFGDARAGFVLAKTGDAHAKGNYIVSGKFPHCLVIAPTGRGKGVSFVTPNLLSFKGSAVVLDVKGENYENTARFREKMGHKVYRFAPRDFDEPSFRYNPLDKIKDYTNPAKRMAELERIATLFLQTEDGGAADFLPNSRDIFVACGILAYEQNDLTLRNIYRLAMTGGDNQKKFERYRQEVKDKSAKQLFDGLAATTEKTLSAYVSVLKSAGLGTWSNPHTCAVTDVSDFDFSTFRKQPQTLYLTVSFNDIPAIAPLIRLFFSDLIASLQRHEPGPDEPFPVLILMDEFQRIGRVPIVAESISLLRSYGGNLAIITQTIPDLDVIYGEQVRKTLQGGAGIKLYLTPSESDTIAEMSESVGMTTKRVVSKSKSIKDGILANNVSEKTEEHPLLTKDEARRMPEDEVIIVVDADMPIRAKRIIYYDDAVYKTLYESQDFSTALPAPPKAITEADYRFGEDRDDVSDDRARAAEEREAAKENAGSGQSEVSGNLDQQGGGLTPESVRAAPANQSSPETGRERQDQSEVERGRVGIMGEPRPLPDVPTEGEFPDLTVEDAVRVKASVDSLVVAAA